MPRLRSAIDPDAEAAELRSYLGAAYDHERLVHYEAQLEDELREIGDEQALYRRSQAYLYNLTAFAMTGTKDPYRAWIDERFPSRRPAPRRGLRHRLGRLGADGRRPRA